MFSVAAVSMCGKVLGSVQRVILDSATWLRQAGICNTLMANMVLPADMYDYAFLRECRDAGFDYETLVARRQFSFSVLRRLAQLARERGIPILHSHGYKSNAHCLLAARHERCRWVSTLHMWTEHNLLDKIYTTIDQIMLRYADRCITVSEQSKVRAVQKGIPQDRIEVVHNWIDVRGYIRKASAAVPNDILSEKQAGRTLILTAGRLSPEKGLRFLLLTLKKVANIHPQVLCLIAGDGPSHSYLVREVQRLGLGDYVKLLGHRPDLPAIMRLVDWFVLPSLREGLPLVLLEAFALSKPVIATAVGGVPEVVVDGVNGWLVPPRDTTALAEALSRALYLSEQERCEMGEAGRAIVEERFTPEAQIPKIGRLYQKLLAEHSSCG